MIHLDWHLGRPGHDHRSFDLAYHWLLAVPTFTPLAWLVCRRWRDSPFRAALIMTVLGVLLGQGLEPLGETVHFGAGAEPFTNHLRWRIFAEFMTAGLIILLLGILLFRSRGRATLRS
jgi:uncharacterized membrane protein YhaH (DUF805 family)